MGNAELLDASWVGRQAAALQGSAKWLGSEKQLNVKMKKESIRQEPRHKVWLQPINFELLEVLPSLGRHGVLYKNCFWTQGQRPAWLLAQRMELSMRSKRQ